MACNYQLCTLLFFIAFQLVSARKLISQLQVDSRNDVIYITKFNFDKGGTFEMKIDLTQKLPTNDPIPNRTMLYLLVCTVEEYTSRVSSLENVSNKNTLYCWNGGYTDLNLCTSYPITDVDQSTKDYHGVSTISYTFNTIEKGHYVFTLSNCEYKGELTGYVRGCNAELDASNEENTKNSTFCFLKPPISDGLVVGEVTWSMFNNDCKSDYGIPYSSLYIGNIVIWGCTLIAWLWNVFGPPFEAVNFQKQITKLPIVKFIHVVVACIYWNIKSNCVEYESFYPIISPLVLALPILFSIAALEILLWIAHGWMITKPDISVKEKCDMYTLLFFTAASSALLLYYDVTEENASFLFFFALVVCRGTVLYKVWHHATINLSILQYQMDLIKQENIDPYSTPVYAKAKLYRGYRILFVGYIFLLIVSDVVTILSEKNIWISIFFSEILDFSICATLGYTFRVRQCNLILYNTYSNNSSTIRPPDDPRSSSLPYVNSINSTEELFYPRNNTVSWRVGMEIPVVPSNMFSHNKKSVIVVQPDNAKDLGTDVLECSKGNPSQDSSHENW